MNQIMFSWILEIVEETRYHVEFLKGVNISSKDTYRYVFEIPELMSWTSLASITNRIKTFIQYFQLNSHFSWYALHMYPAHGKFHSQLFTNRNHSSWNSIERFLKIHKTHKQTRKLIRFSWLSFSGADIYFNRFESQINGSKFLSVLVFSPIFAASS